MIKKTSPRKKRLPPTNRPQVRSYPPEPYPMTSTNVNTHDEEIPGFFTSLLRGLARGLFWAMAGVFWPETMLIWYLAGLGGYRATMHQHKEFTEPTPIRVVSLIAHIFGAFIGLVLLLTWLAPPGRHK